ncbi:MAG TPA: hypothetical protein VF310_11260 [Vicinamibacteria bacterium]
MRRTLAAAAVQWVLLAPAAVAAADGALSELMQTLSGAVEALDSNVALKEAKAGAAEARRVEDLLRDAEARFGRDDAGADAAGLARKSQGLAAEVRRSLEAEDYEAASGALGSLVRSCEACHQAHRR